MPLHLVSFMPLASTLRFWQGGQLSDMGVAGEMRLSFEMQKACTGYNDGEHFHPCPILFPGRKQCAPCARRDISRVYTRLDTEGFEQFYEKYREQPFSVYLASFGHIVKCGVTRSERLLQRVTEQGADYFAEVGHTSDADSAYSLESAIQSHFPVRSGLSSSFKLKLMRSDSNPSRLEDCMKKVKESGLLDGFEGELKARKLEFQIPREFSESGNLFGRVTGSKGQIVFFERDGADYAFNMSAHCGGFFTRG